jgi:hypothetical protein
MRSTIRIYPETQAKTTESRMAFSDYSTTPSLNVSIGGISSAEGCPAANINNICRQLAADGRALYDTVAAIDISALMPKAGGVFTGQITRSGGGGYFYNANSAQGGGKVSFLANGSPNPSSPSEGDMAFFYS